MRVKFLGHLMKTGLNGMALFKDLLYSHIVNYIYIFTDKYIFHEYLVFTIVVFKKPM